MKLTKFLIMLVLLFPIGALAQLTVSGTVTDETNFPLPGASILVKGTSKGEVTDIDGKFTITLDQTPATLVVSYIGYVTKEVPITSQTTINITLETNQEQLDEVVVIGYGEVQRKDVTGSISSLKPEEKVAAVNNTVESLIQGRAAGVQVSASGAEPGAPLNIKIRGTNSLTGSTQPLYVIDGIIMDSANEDVVGIANDYLPPQQGISGINPRDIADIQILKDASATAIYGSRGSNGVIIITTKRGKSGKAKFNYNVTTSLGQITNNIEVLDSQEFVEYQNTAASLSNSNPKYYVYPDQSIAQFMTDEQYMIDNSATIPRLEPVDWSEDVYRPSIGTNHRLSVSGGGDTGNYYAAAGYMKTEGVVPRTWANQTDFTLNLNQDLSDRLELGAKISTSFMETSASRGTEDLGGSNNNVIRQIIQGIPFRNVPDNFFGDDGNFEEGIDGPRAWIEGYDDLSEEIRLLGRIQLDYKLSEVFTYRILLGTDYRKKDRKQWYGNEVFRGAQFNGVAQHSQLNRFRYNLDNTLRFRKRFNRAHRINGTVGVTFDQKTLEQNSQLAQDFGIQDLRADGISYGQVYQPPFYDRQKETILSFIGRLNYTLLDRYIFTATFRADGSSKFASDNRWSYFPAFAFAWNIKEENLFNESETVNDLKLRLGWGRTGNQNIPNYRYLTPYGPTFTPLSNANGGVLTSLVPTNLANPDLIWETTSQYNAGIDFGFFNNRLSGTVDVYYKKISDLLLDVRVGGSTGFTSYYANQGDILNQGLEVSLNAAIIDSKFKWNVFGNISFNRNEVDNLGISPAPLGNGSFSFFRGEQISGGNYFKVPANIYIEGEPTALFFGYETDGIINTQEELADAPTFNNNTPQLGDVNLIDQNGDGLITDDDLTIIGDPNPDFIYGFGSDFQYGNLSLSLFFNGVYGNEIANGGAVRDAYADGTNNNIRRTAYYNAYSADNPNGTSPRIGYNIQDETGFTDRLVEDGSFLRLKNVTLSYNIPVGETKFFDSASVSITGQNLLLFTDYTGFDPEVNSFANNPLKVAVDWNSFPNQKTVILGLNLSF